MLENVRQDSDKFDLNADKNKWSVHQILAHLITAEKLSVQYIAKKRQGIDKAGDTGLLEELKMLVLKISQRLPLKFKTPQTVVAASQSYSSLDELIADWDATRKSFRQLLEQIKEDELKRKIYKHVAVGKLNIMHAVLFLREHVTHHLPQVNLLLKSN